MISSFARIAPRFGISDVSLLISQIYNLVTSLLCLAILFGMMDKEYLEKEIAIMDNMFKEEKKQYEKELDTYLEVEKPKVTSRLKEMGFEIKS